MYFGCLMHQSIPAATIPPRDSVGHLYAYLSPQPGICSYVFTRGQGICQSRVITPGHLSLRERTAATSFLCCMPKWTTIKYIKQILYYIIVECWFSSVNQCLSGCLTKNHAERFRLKIRFPLYFYHELPLS